MYTLPVQENTYDGDRCIYSTNSMRLTPRVGLDRKTVKNCI